MAVLDRPISFSAPMALAVHQDRKTQTRRLASPAYFRFFDPTNRPDESWRPDPEELAAALTDAHDFRRMADECMIWKARAFEYQIGDWTNWMAQIVPAIGDRLWMREPIRQSLDPKHRDLASYSCDDTVIEGVEWRWKPSGLPSRYMPKELCRQRLILNDFRVQRVQEISESDAKAEGASYHDGRGIGHSGWRHDLRDVFPDARSSYAHLWDSLHKPGDRWDDNPWVVALSFEKIDG